MYNSVNYLSGDTSIEHRAKAIKRFRDDEDVKILVAGLKCGGLG
jgi:SNF2 family DNA or RNA helicase